jgi:import inner membrane translocase subunit TIM22
MGKGKGASRKADGQSQDEAVLNLTIDGSFPNAEVREVTPPAPDAFQTPCSISGLMAGVSGGSLGYAFGFCEFFLPFFLPTLHTHTHTLTFPFHHTFFLPYPVGYWMSNRLKGGWRPSLDAGWTSAKTFAVMGGLYAGVSCFMLRLRQKQDAWNGAASGCATGLALGWPTGGAIGALQSCAMFGAFSYFLDGMAGGGDGEAVAATLQGGGSGSGHEKKREKSALELLLSPAVPLARALAPCSSWAGEHEGCRIVTAPRNRS